MTEMGSSILAAPEIITIKTERLEMRTLQMSDLPDIARIISDPAVMKWTSRPAINDMDLAERWLSDRALGPDVFNFAVREKSASEGKSLVIGIVGSFHWPKVGYLIRSDFAGRGYATEALKAIIPAYFDRVPTPGDGHGGGHDHLEGWTDTENHASQKILTKCGFRLCATFENDFDNPTTGLRSSNLYCLPRPGKTLEQLGLIQSDATEMDGPEPPIQ